MNSLRFAFRLRGRRAGCSALRCVTVTPTGEFCGANSASVQRDERLAPRFSRALSTAVISALRSSRFRVQKLPSSFVFPYDTRNILTTYTRQSTNVENLLCTARKEKPLRAERTRGLGLAPRVEDQPLGLHNSQHTPQLSITLQTKKVGNAFQSNGLARGSVLRSRNDMERRMQSLLWTGPSDPDGLVALAWHPFQAYGVPSAWLE